MKLLTSFALFTVLQWDGRSHLLAVEGFLPASRVGGSTMISTWTSPHKFRRPSVMRLLSMVQSVEDMGIQEIKIELESYGISTQLFFEKNELVHALKRARAEGRTQKNSSPQNSKAYDTDTRPREVRLQEMMEVCAFLTKVELKAELEDRGISTRALLEKADYVRALAVARVDNVDNVETKNSELITDYAKGPRPSQEYVKNDPNHRQSGSSAYSDPYAPMGGIADMLKNMQGTHTKSANPDPEAEFFHFDFSHKEQQHKNGRTSPFGEVFTGGSHYHDAISQAQQLMKYPQVTQLMSRAQSNPTVMQALQECMANPDAIGKYQSDPEIASIVNELQHYMGDNLRP